MKLYLPIAYGLMLSAAINVYAADESSSKGAVSVKIIPFTVQPSEMVTITGIAPLDAKGLVSVRVTPPNGKPAIELKATPAANGDYSLNFRATTEVGSYVVNATSPGGRITGQGKFTVTVMEPLNEIADSIKEAQKIAAAIKEISADMDVQIPKLPDSPARDTLKAKWAVLKPKLAQASQELTEIESFLSPLLEAAKQNPKLKPALLPIAKELDDWTRTALPERERIVRELQQSRGKNVTCENLERVVEGFNFASALFNLMGGPINAIKSVVIDYVADGTKKLGEKLADTFGFAVGESTKITAAVVEAKLLGKLEGKTVLTRLATKEALRSNVAGLLSDMSSFLASQAFSKYCERFGGNFQGKMEADFFATKSGKKWWSYDISYSGKLDLRYAKGSTEGQAVAVNGEFIGKATNFTLWEDAIRVGWPDLTASAIMFKRAVLPKPQLTNMLGVEDKVIDIEGKAAATFAKPYTFFVPVEGEIVKGVLTLRLKPATSDYSAAARVVYVMISPLSNVAGTTAFELPYKEADFFFKRVSKGAPMQFKVVKQGNKMTIDGFAKNEQGNSIANGKYFLKMQLCNPPPTGDAC